MVQVFEVARVIFLQLVRDRIFQLASVFFLIVVAINFLFSEMSIAERERIYVNFGLSLVQVCTVAIAIILSIVTFRRETESKSLYTTLVRPISRERYLLGQYLGVVGIVSGLLLCFSLMLHLVFLQGQSTEFYLLYYLAVLGIWIEGALAASLGLFLAVSMSYPVAIGLTFATVFLGHWMSSFRFFLNTAENPVYIFVGELVYWSLPHLERVNFRSWPIVPAQVSVEQAGWGLLQILTYIVVFVTISCLVFRGRDID